MPHTRTVKTPELYEELVAGFRKSDNISLVSREAGVSYRFGAMAYTVGWPEFEWAPPIRYKLQVEGEVVRARMQAVEEEAARRMMEDPELLARLRAEIQTEAFEAAQRELSEGLKTAEAQREKARQQAANTRQEEAELAKLFRGRAKLLLAAGASPVQAFLKLGTVLEKRINLIIATPDKDLAQIDPQELISLLSRFTELQLKLATLAQVAQVIDRKAAGEPDFVFANRSGEMSYEEALKVLQSASVLGAQNGLTVSNGTVYPTPIPDTPN